MTDYNIYAVPAEAEDNKPKRGRPRKAEDRKPETVFEEVVADALEDNEEPVQPFYPVDQLGRSALPKEKADKYQRMTLLRPYVPLGSDPLPNGPGEDPATLRFDKLRTGAKIDFHWREAERLNQLGIAAVDFRGFRNGPVT